MLNGEKVRVAIVIPARYGSTRLPGKPLADILGKPMVQHVYERACQVSGVHAVLVATDDARVAEVVKGFGGQCVMTSPDHPSGTDRLAEVMAHVAADIYINLQGDEPLVRPEDIARLAAGMLDDASVQVGTLCHGIDGDEALNPNSVKVVLASNGDALYFSRSPIPYPRDAEAATYLKHVGVYAYRREVLAAYAELPQPMVEQAEKLEQLRLLAAGMRIRAFEVAPTGPGVDTPECLARVRALMAGEQSALPPSLADVRLVITDVDGVLTDGGIYYDATGECLKRFHVRDGLGIRLLEENGVRVAVLSGRDSETLRKRVADLGVTIFQFGVRDKFAACRALMAQADATPEQTVCIGDDSIDLPAFAACGLSYAVADSASYVKARATGALSTRGGEGAFRELADAILLAQGKAQVFGTAEGFATVMSGVAQ
ncbi:3-deoxy-manno-octulosonate cytidylyltransferase [Cupriavidus taiwanensis]|uniref:3-deoxy-manno-octulosonate cytidylyltransferase n=1 Tax=Cupriavidus taiwanensis TaxID=164546 RepID=UPI000E10624C|nr:3-deoxy-manno-octulosonate cytidylyltransferase [Cupriavidus taiwanensis]SOY61274.1 3-deoxy-manno-octulosonate cytidylyltransferase [Cupriavidus taiwanensis]SOY61495.1 3-deoxy-manno-octulosonate cytidylyltransferase [Cupriavidus taiwanensis]SOY97988.1 3-deoxy-manno-octulosonate cytidylyltransferase [Cupriavidus taiwanensis]SOZ68310.1 3-deoxy-manno-octulosonate cytidylyltransferase [Cupriavidus taiwanensis]SOZ84909.1 3-deoxy-manno-octulosonate cytidylyltransferase [Cupriavidus taiwanensis]